jgi:hypothetical protein
MTPHNFDQDPHQDHIPSAGITAYYVYAAAVGFKAHDGNPIPEWDQLPEPIRRAWNEVAFAFGYGVVRQAALAGVPIETAESKHWRLLIQELTERIRGCASMRESRARSIALTRLEEAQMWLGKDLGAQRKEGVGAPELGTSAPAERVRFEKPPYADSPYVESFDPLSSIIEAPKGLDPLDPNTAN